MIFGLRLVKASPWLASHNINPGGSGREGREGGEVEAKLVRDEGSLFWCLL